MATLREGRFARHHGVGLLENVFTPDRFAALAGTAGIGHTRYATIGKKDLSMLQPFISPDERLAVAHNGNIVNYHPLREEIQAGAPDGLKTGCDSEVILWFLSQALDRAGYTPDGLRQSVSRLSERLAGSYAVVGLSPEIGLFGFRDPNGLRPLVMGRRTDESGQVSTAFASETAALAFLGYDELTNIAPGELVLVQPDGTVHRFAFAPANLSHCMFEWVYFARVESEMDELPVYQARFNLGAELAKTIQAQGLSPDIVVPVPETSRIAAIALAEGLNKPFREVLIKNRYINRTFILESQSARQEALRRKLYPVASELRGKKVLVVDDSIVRGNTAIKIIELLRKSGAEEIYLASTCPPIKHPCYYGIDFPDSNELMAAKHDFDSLAQVLGVDALIYQTMEGLQNALGLPALCTACLTGEYPTDVAAGIAFSRQRVQERQVHTVSQP